MENNKLPPEWEWKKFREVADFINGRAFKPSEWGKIGLPIIRIQNLTDSSKEFNYFDGKVQEDNLIYKGDILISWSASLGAFIWGGDKAVLNQHIFKVNVNDKIIDKKYFFYVTQTKIEEMKTRVHGSTMKHIIKGDFEKILIPVPPIHIQKQIVKILDRAESLKEKRIKSNYETKKIIQLIFMEMFGDPTKNNKKYPIEVLDNIADKITDGTHITPNYLNEGVPFLRVTDITNSNESKKFISKEEHQELTKRCKPEKGDILYTKNGTIGIAKTIDWDYEFSIFVSLCLIKPNKEKVLSKYLEVFLNTPFALAQALQHSKKGTITNLHLIEIKKIKIPIPPISKQREFLDMVEKVEKIMKHQENSTIKIENLSESLMQQAFNGGL